MAARLLLLARRAKAETRRRADAPSITAQGDETGFHVDDVGGEPLPFLTRRAAADIAEILGYRTSEAALSEFDVRATIAAHMQGADWASLVFQETGSRRSTWRAGGRASRSRASSCRAWPPPRRSRQTQSRWLPSCSEAAIC